MVSLPRQFNFISSILIRHSNTFKIVHKSSNRILNMGKAVLLLKSYVILERSLAAEVEVNVDKAVSLIVKSGTAFPIFSFTSRGNTAK